MPSAKISALTALDSTANLAQLYIPLFKADGSPDNPRILASDLLLAADGVNITPAWSGTGVQTSPLLVNVSADPGPASAATMLLDLQILGVSKARFNKAGQLTCPSAFVNDIYAATSLQVQSNSGSLVFGASSDVALTRDAADVLALRRSTNANHFRVYQTFTNSTDNFSRGVFGFRDASGSVPGTPVLRIGTEKGSLGGTARDVAIITDGTERLTFAAAGGQTAADGHNMAFGTSTGTKIGTATGQKIGFWNATPVVQQVLATGAGATVDNVITLLQTLGLCKQS